MKTFISFAADLNLMLPNLIANDELHVRWLNTLSYLENCGARKIAACEHPTLVKEEMLKHAAEEFRHAFHLKKQIGKVSNVVMEDYSLPTILGGVASWNYLRALDAKTCRYLKELGLARTFVKEAAYLLVTYAIELRASELYVIYHDILRKNNSAVSIKSILLEEKEHLQEMENSLQDLLNGNEYAEYVCAIESALCQKWLEAITESALY